MVESFQDTEIIASEPIEYTFRKEDGYITRYGALSFSQSSRGLNIANANNNATSKIIFCKQTKDMVIK